MRRPYRCCPIKLKKEYIGNFGDIGAFAIVGARYDAAKARTYNILHLKWAHFYVGCLENREEVGRFGKKPKFVVTNVVKLDTTQLARWWLMPTRKAYRWTTTVPLTCGPSQASMRGDDRFLFSPRYPSWTSAVFLLTKRGTLVSGAQGFLSPPKYTGTEPSTTQSLFNSCRN